MEIFSNILYLREYLKQKKQLNKSLGFVPTMGALHNGHLELIKASTNHNDITICSIFVNPTQFNNPVDLENYPRETQSDINKLESVNCDVIFIPSSEIMYEENPVMNFEFGYLEKIMEGKYRPGHFKGVGLVIAKLFNIVEPDNAYFGKKDLQQLSIIKSITKELLFNIEIIPVDTVREQDGLAMSSRNTLLSEKERLSASNLNKALMSAKEKLKRGENVISVKKYIKDLFTTNSDIDLEYFEIVCTEDLQQISEIPESNKVSLCIAGQLGKVRLIDNISLN
jgi:pantoate--beta-alanine ligase